jgi:polysaccharide export outer membrane protein
MSMIARTLHIPCRAAIMAAGLLCASMAGCHGLARKHEVKQIPQFGTIDPSQPSELRKVAQAPYVIEPPDELEITAQPPLPGASVTNFVVGADGFVDLGLAGDVFVYGLTLPEAEERIAAQLNDSARREGARENPRSKVAVRLAVGQSKYFYVLGTVANPGRFKAVGNDTVLDAILQAGLKSNSLPEKAYLVRPHPLGGEDQVLKIDWFGIKDRGDTLTNYQLFPGDRVVVPGTRPPGLLSTLLGN